MEKQMILSLFDFRFKKEAGFKPLMDAIEGLTAEQASWKPMENSHSIWQIVNHLVFWNSRMLKQLRGEPLSPFKIDNDATFKTSNDLREETWQKTVDQIHSIFEEMQEVVSQFDDSRLNASTDDEGMPLKVLLGDMAMHDAYHIGQILYIRKLQGI